ncbi:MAG TPA: ABC transporter ATP-binding protein [Nitrospiria bacterium]
MNAIEVNNLTKIYKLYSSPKDRLKEILSRKKNHHDFYALNDISFNVEKGQTVGIIGQNGSGKSTLLQIICGVLQPTGGSVLVNGRIAAMLELGAGFNPEFTGRDNVYMNGALIGFSRKEMDRRFPDIQAFAEIGEFVDQPVKTYSSGMFVRLAFAAAIHVDPDILVVDEALAVGDAYFVHRCMLRIRELQAAGVTIVLVTHDSLAVRSLCTNTLWLDGGVVRLQGCPETVVDEYLADVFQQPIVAKEIQVGPPRNSNEPAGPEVSIPNIDRRVGNQACSIIGVGLYDTSLRPIASASNDSMIVLRATVRNNSLPPETRLSVGYVFRSHRGDEIASTNTTLEGTVIPAGRQGETITVQMRIHLPMVYPGSYSLSPTTGYVAVDGENIMADRIENALRFQIESLVRVHVMMRFRTDVIVEKNHESVKT